MDVERKPRRKKIPNIPGYDPETMGNLPTMEEAENVAIDGLLMLAQSERNRLGKLLRSDGEEGRMIIHAASSLIQGETSLPNANIQNPVPDTVSQRSLVPVDMQPNVPIQLRPAA